MSSPYRPPRLAITSDLSVSRSLNTLLEGAYWPKSLSPRQGYARRHDDTDGRTGPDEDLELYIGPDGDMWVIQPQGLPPLRFRTLSGGGQSLRVRNALLVLAEAIRRDNEEHPQRIGRHQGE